MQDTGLIQGISEAPPIGVVRGDGRAAAGARRGDPEGSRRREPVLVHRRRRHQHDAQQRPHADQPEAARRARRTRQRHHPPAAARARRGPRHHALHAAGAGPDDRRHGQPRPVPVRRSGRQPGRACAMGAEAGRAAAAACRSSRTCRATSRTTGLSAYVAHRPRDRGAVRHHPGDGRQRALRCLRPAHRLDDLHPVEPVPRDPRSRAGAAADRWRRSTRSICRPRPPPTARCRCRRSPRCVEQTGAAGDQPSRPVPGDDDLVQPGARRLARRRGRGDPAGARRRSACRPA